MQPLWPSGENQQRDAPLSYSLSFKQIHFLKSDKKRTKNNVNVHFIAWASFTDLNLSWLIPSKKGCTKTIKVNTFTKMYKCQHSHSQSCYKVPSRRTLNCKEKIQVKIKTPCWESLLPFYWDIEILQTVHDRAPVPLHCIVVCLHSLQQGRQRYISGWDNVTR